MSPREREQSRQARSLTLSSSLPVSFALFPPLSVSQPERQPRSLQLVPPVLGPGSKESSRASLVMVPSVSC